MGDIVSKLNSMFHQARSIMKRLKWSAFPGTRKR